MTEKNNPDAIPLLEINGKDKRRFLKKIKNHICVTEDRLDIAYDGCRDDIDIRNIVNIFIKEPIFPNDSRITAVDYYSEGQECLFELPDNIFEGLSYSVESLLKVAPEGRYPFYEYKKNHPDTLKWLNSFSAIYTVASDMDFELFGGEFPTPKYHKDSLVSDPEGQGIKPTFRI